MNTDSRWATVLLTAARQAGLATRQQILAAGYTAKEWMQLRRSGAVLALQRGLYQISQAEDPWRREAWAMLLLAGPDAVLSHRSAARLHELWAYDRAAMPLEVTIPRGRRLVAADFFTFHRSHVSEEERTVVGGLRATNVVRTVFDLARILDFEALAMAFESARRAPRFLEAVEARLVDSGDRGEALSRLLEDAKRRPRPFDSAFEVMFWLRLKLSMLPPPKPQFEFKSHHNRTYFIDFAWPDQKVAVELEGFDAHGQSAFNSDKRRSAALASAGWLYLPLTFDRYRIGLFAFLNEVAAAVTRRTSNAA